MRETLKRLVEGTASRSGLARLLQRGMRGRRLVLAYHNVVPRGERPWGEASLHVSASRFARHMDVLGRTCTVVPLDALLGSPDTPSERPMVAITFDDAYQGAIHAAQGELARRGMPATFFVSPGLAGEEGFWWDRLAHPSGGALPDSLRSRCLSELQGRQARVLEWAREAGRATPAAPEHSRPAGESQLRGLARARGVTVGSHTWSHPNLVRLSREDRLDELERANRWLTEFTDRVRPWLAYPYGLQSELVRRDVSDAGLVAGLLVEGGWVPRRDADPFALPRLNVPAGLTADGLRLRLAGLAAR